MTIMGIPQNGFSQDNNKSHAKNLRYGEKLSLWLVCILVFSFLNHRETIPNKLIFSKKNVEDSVVALKLSFVGDLMCHSPQYEFAKIEKDSFDFRQDYRFVMEYLSDADITFGNLETVTAGKKKVYSGFPLFNSPDNFVEALKYSGFDFLFTSNNHTMDRGQFGVLKTIENLDKNNLLHTGSFISHRDRDSIRIISKNGIKLAVLAYTFSVNGNLIPKGCSYLVNLIDTSLIRKDISKARSSGVDLVLVYFHFGDEYARTKSKYQDDAAAKAVSYGADIIIGSHPHVLQPIVFFKGNHSKLDSVFIAYSLGNFISSQRDRYEDAGVILNIELKKDVKKDSVYLGEISFIPTWVFKGNTGKKNEYIIFPSETAAFDTTVSFLSPAMRKKAEQSLNDSKEMLTKYTSRVKFKSAIKIK